MILVMRREGGGLGVMAAHRDCFGSMFSHARKSWAKVGSNLLFIFVNQAWPESTPEGFSQVASGFVHALAKELFCMVVSSHFSSVTGGECTLTERLKETSTYVCSGFGGEGVQINVIGDTEGGGELFPMAPTSVDLLCLIWYESVR